MPNKPSTSTAALTAARKHFETLRGQLVEVPEWGREGIPFRLYIDQASWNIQERCQKRANGNAFRAIIYALMECAKLEDGSLAFPDHIDTIKALECEVDPEVVGRLGQVVFGSGDDAGN